MQQSLDEFREFLSLPTDFVNLNTGALSPTAHSVWIAANELRHVQSTDPGRFWPWIADDRLRTSREALGRWLNATPERLYFTRNICEGENLILHAMETQARRNGHRQKVLLCECDYGAVHIIWGKSQTLDIIVVPTSGCASAIQVIEMLSMHLSDQVLAVHCSHVVQSTGRIMPLDGIREICHRHGAFLIVDGAHALGALDLSMKEVAADAYIGSLHKWAMGVSSAGFLYVNTIISDLLEPVVVSWGKRLSLEYAVTSDPLNTPRHQAVENHGSVDRVPQMVAPEIIAFWQQLGPTAARDSMRALATYAKYLLNNLLEPLPEWEDSGQHPGLTAFSFPQCDRAAYRQWMLKRNISSVITRIREDLQGSTSDTASYQSTNWLRVSTGWFTTKRDIDTFAEALQELLTTRPREVFRAE